VYSADAPHADRPSERTNAAIAFRERSVALTARFKAFPYGEGCRRSNRTCAFRWPLSATAQSFSGSP